MKGAEVGPPRRMDLRAEPRPRAEVEGRLGLAGGWGGAVEDSGGGRSGGPSAGGSDQTMGLRILMRWGWAGAPLPVPSPPSPDVDGSSSAELAASCPEVKR